MSRLSNSVATASFLFLATTGLAPQAFAALTTSASNTVQAGYETVTELVIKSQFDAKNGVDVTLTFDAPVAVSVLKDELRQQGDAGSPISVQGETAQISRSATARSIAMTTAEIAQQTATSPASSDQAPAFKPRNNPAGAKPQDSGQPTAAKLQCNRFYSYSNFDGTYTIQRACGSTSAPWGLKLSAYWQSHAATGLVSERGLDWKVNGANRPRTAPHPNTLANYTFHSYYYGVKDNYNVSYVDIISFRHNIGPGGNASLTFYGDHSFLGEDGSTCQPGKPC